MATCTEIQTVSFAVDARRLRNALQRCNTVRDTGSTRYVLDSIRWFSKRGDTSAYVEATDGRRIVRCYLDAVDADVEFDIATHVPSPCKLPLVSARVHVIVPLDTLRTNVVVEISETRKGNTSERALYFAAIDGRFPDTDRIFAEINPDGAVCHVRDEMQSLLNLFPEERGTMLKGFELNADKYVVKSTGIPSRSNDSLNVVSGKLPDIAFSNQYVREFACWFDDDAKFDLYVWNAHEAVVFGHGCVQYVLMPLAMD